jgi:MFS family permease
LESGPAAGPPADWGRAFAIQLAVAALCVTAVHAGRPTVTYRALELGASTFDIGLIQAAFSILPTLLAVVIGRWVDRTGEGAWLAVAMGVMTLGGIIGTYAGDLLGLGASQLVLGMGQILFLVAGQSLVANYGPRERRDARFGHYATAHSVGQLAGPALAAIVIGGGLGLAGWGPLGALLPPTSSGHAFLVSTLLTGAATLLALFLPRPRRGRPGEASPSPQPGIVAMTRQVMRRRGMPAAMVVSIIVASAVDMVIAYLPVYGETAGLSVGLVGLLLTVRGVAALVSRFFMPQLIALLSRERALALSMLLAGGGLIALPFVTSDWVLVLLMVAAGLGLGLGQPMTISWVATRSPRSERATALGVRLTGNRASLLLIPPVLGAVAGAAGVTAIFVVLAGSLVGGAAVASVTPFDELAEPPGGRRPGQRQ